MSQEKLNKDDSSVWYNEIPPRVFFNIDEFKDGRAALYQQKWQKEILDQQLDIQQRQILKDQRLARIYLNPPNFRRKPKPDVQKLQAVKEQAVYNKEEHQHVEILSRRHMNQTCAIYGINFRDAGGQSETKTVSSLLSSRGKMCQKLRRLTPFHGPFALRVFPWETLSGTPLKKRYQVKIFRDKLAAHDLLEEESKDIKQYATTPHAVWRQHRFACPEGSDFRDLKEQVRLAKYRAMLNTKDLLADGDIVVGNAKLTSHFKPWTGKLDENVDCDDFFEDKVLMAKAREGLELRVAQLKASQRENNKKIAQQTTKSIRNRKGPGAINTQKSTRVSLQKPVDSGSRSSMDTKDSRERGTAKSSLETRSTSLKEIKDSKAIPNKANAGSNETSETFFEKKPLFSVEEEYLEDLQSASLETRKQLSNFLVPRPVGQYYPDPREDPKYRICFKIEEERKKKRPYNF